MGFFNKKQKQAPAKKEIKALVSDHLSEKRVLFFSHGPSKRQILGSLIGALDLSDPSGALKAILEREEKGSTIVTDGFALPHARISGLPQLEAALALCPEGVVDPMAGGALIKIFLLFLGPAEDMKMHLAFLANVSSLFQDEAFRKELLKLSKPADVIARIREAEKKSG